jgi:hypothetical protein
VLLGITLIHLNFVLFKSPGAFLDVSRKVKVAIKRKCLEKIVCVHKMRKFVLIKCAIETVVQTSAITLPSNSVRPIYTVQRKVDAVS